MADSNPHNPYELDIDKRLRALMVTRKSIQGAIQESIQQLRELAEIGRTQTEHAPKVRDSED